MINFCKRAASALEAFPQRFTESEFRSFASHRAAWLGLLLTLTLSSVGWSQLSAKLSWNPSTDPTVIGYNIYFGGGSGNYTNMISLGTATTAVVNGLVEGGTYYFAVTAFDATGQESLYSNEAIYAVPGNSAALLTVNSALNGAFVLKLAGRAAHAYEIQATTDFVTWTVLGTQTTAADGSLSFTDPSAGNFSQRFYRTRDLLP